jgi:hypothetical protein
MHATHDTGTALSGRGPGRLRRWFAQLADRLSPTLRCDECGVVSKRRTFRLTGSVRTIDVHSSPWTPWAVCEQELICPNCNGSVWEVMGGARSGLTYM